MYTQTHLRYLTTLHTQFNCPPDTKCNKLSPLNYVWCFITPARTFSRGQSGEETTTCLLKMKYSLQLAHFVSGPDKRLKCYLCCYVAQR